MIESYIFLNNQFAWAILLDFISTLFSSANCTFSFIRGSSGPWPRSLGCDCWHLSTSLSSSCGHSFLQWSLSQFFPNWQNFNSFCLLGLSIEESLISLESVFFSCLSPYERNSSIATYSYASKCLLVEL